jgi:TLD
MDLILVYEVYYCTKLGKVRGLLTITEHVIVFEALKIGEACEIQTQEGIETGDAMMFQAYIDMNDIINCNIIELQGDRISDEVFYIEFSLSRTGRERHGLRTDIPKVNVYFKLARILSNGESLQYLYLKTYTDQILALVNSSILRTDKNRADSGTFVPFYDINRTYLGRLNSGLEVPDDDEEFKECLKEMQDDEKQQQEVYILPKMSSESKLLTPKMISQVLLSIPKVFQYRSWELLYATYKHGRSLTSFYRNTEKPGPNILVVKDHQKFVFGGYFSGAWKKCSGPYGTGECFVFTFKNTERMKCYYSGLVNTFYMFSDNDALVVGSGGAAGIYIDKNFESGTSGKSQTYNNQVLSSEEHYDIIDIELWGLI